MSLKYFFIFLFVFILPFKSSESFRLNSNTCGSKWYQVNSKPLAGPLYNVINSLTEVDLLNNLRNTSNVSEKLEFSGIFSAFARSQYFVSIASFIITLWM